MHYTVCDGFSHYGPASTALLWVYLNMATMAAATRPAAGLTNDEHVDEKHTDSVPITLVLEHPVHPVLPRWLQLEEYQPTQIAWRQLQR